MTGFADLPDDWIVSMAPQGSIEWLSSRRGAITGSMARVAREKLKSGLPTKAAITYLRDVARERVGGIAQEVYVNAAMRFGTDQEPHARRAYEVLTGYMVDPAGFISTPDRKFGVSVDGLVFDEPGQRGGIEIKTIVSSNVLFDAFVSGDITDYMDQVDMNTWAWHLDWIDLCLWAPDLPVDTEGMSQADALMAAIRARLCVIRIHRNHARIDKLLVDLMAADRTVEALASELRDRLADPLDRARLAPVTHPTLDVAPANFAEADF